MLPKRKLTIKDIARLANVSAGTVSRALNGRAGVSPETRARILELVRKHNFMPSQAARELVGHTTKVGVLVPPDVPRYTPYFSLLLEALSEELWRLGLTVARVPTDARGLPSEGIRACILLGAHDHDPRIEVLRGQGTPFVLVGVHPEAFWVAPDDEGGAYQATRHLLELGHRDILHITGHLHHQAGRERLQGYRRALLQAGLPFRPELVLDGKFQALAAYRALRGAWEAGLRFTAVFAASDEMAQGALAALEDLGLRVPTQVSLVGYDDLPQLGENLTTVHQDIRTVALEAVNLLEEALAGKQPRGKRVPVHLVARGSTARREVG